MLSANGGKVVEKLIETVTFFELIEQRLHRHACARENRRAAEDVIRSID
jgi:hypothetical protein